MAVIQTSKVQMRRGNEMELPGVPTSLSPLRFEAGLDVGELGFAVDSGRVFIGHGPNLGQANYKRTQFPYQNIEILTEASTETLRRIFGFLSRDQGGESFYTALLAPSEDWQDIAAERASGAAVPYRFPGDDVIASVDYYAISWYSEDSRVHRDPIRQGTLRILSQDCAEEAHVADDSHSMRRRDLTTPFANEGEWAYDNISFRVVRGGTIGDRYHRFQFKNELSHPVRLYFRVARPTRTTTSPFEIPTIANGTGTVGSFTREDIEDIVGAMVSNNVETRINVEYSECSRKLNFEVAEKRGFEPFLLRLRGDVTGVKSLDGFDAEIDTVLANTGVVAGTYRNPTIRVDEKGRVVEIDNGNAEERVYTASNVGSGVGVYGSTSGTQFRFRTLAAGSNMDVSVNGDTVILSARVPSSLRVTGSAAVSAVSEINFGGDLRVTDGGNGRALVTLNVPPSLRLVQNATTIANVAELLVQGAATLTSGENGQAILNITGGGSGGVSGDYVGLTGDETVNGQKTFNANTRITNGTLSVDTPDEYPFCGLEVPMRQPAGTSAYLYWDEAQNAFAAYTGQDNRNLTLTNITADRFIGDASTAERWTTPRLLTLQGAVNGSVLWDGSGDVVMSVASAGSSSNGTTQVAVWDDSTPVTTVATTLDFIGNGVTVSASGNRASVTIPGTIGHYDANAVMVAYTGEILDANHQTPTIWNTVASLQVPAGSFERRAISATAVLGYDASGFKTSRFLRVTINGVQVALANQPWGDANSGGSLSIEHLDTVNSRTGTLTINLDVGYMAFNNASPGFTRNYEVHTRSLKVLRYRGEN